MRKGRLGRSLVGLSTIAVACSVAASAASAKVNTSNAGPGINVKAKTITVGANVQTTGPVSYYYALNEASNAYFDMVNAAGGVDGWKINYKMLNDAYQPAQAVQVVRTLVSNDHVFALVTPEGSPTDTAFSTWLATQPTPVIGPTEGNPDLSKYPNWFVVMPNYTNVAAAVAAYAAKHSSRIALLYEDDDVGQPALSGAKQELAKLGKKLVAAVPFNVTDTNLTPALSQIQKAKPQVVLFWGANAPLAAALKAASQLGVRAQWYGSFFLADPVTVKLAGSLLAGFHAVSFFDPYSETTGAEAQFHNAMSKYAKGVSQGALAENGWNSAAYFVAGMKKLLQSGQPLTQANLVKVFNKLGSVSVGTLVDSIAYGSGSHVEGYSAVRGVRLSTYNKGKWTVTTGLLRFPQGLNYNS